MKRFKEGSPVIIAAAGHDRHVWVCRSLGVEPQQRQRARTAVRRSCQKRADHPERDRPHGHPGCRRRGGGPAESGGWLACGQAAAVRLITQQRRRDGFVMVGIPAFVDDQPATGFHNERHRRFGVHCPAENHWK